MELRDDPSSPTAPGNAVKNFVIHQCWFFCSGARQRIAYAPVFSRKKERMSTVCAPTVALYAYDHHRIGPNLAHAYARASNPAQCLFFTTEQAAAGFLRQGDWEQASEICERKRHSLAALNRVDPAHVFFEHELPPKQQALSHVILYQSRVARCREMTTTLWDYVKPRIGFIDKIQDDWHLTPDPPATDYKTLRAFPQRRIDELMHACQDERAAVTCLAPSISLDCMRQVVRMINAPLGGSMSAEGRMYDCAAFIHQYVETPMHYGIPRRWESSDEDANVIWRAIEHCLARYERVNDSNGNEEDLRDNANDESLRVEALKILCLLYHGLADFVTLARWSLAFIVRRAPSDTEHFYILNELARPRPR